MSSRGFGLFGVGQGELESDNQSHWGLGEGLYTQSAQRKQSTLASNPQALEAFKSNGSRINLHGVELIGFCINRRGFWLPFPKGSPSRLCGRGKWVCCFA